MPKYTQHITEVSPSGEVTVYGGGTPVAALQDASDTTYLTLVYGKEFLLFLPPTVGAGERIVSVCPYVRVKDLSPTYRPRVKYVELPSLGSYTYGALLTVPKNAAATTYALAAQSGQSLHPGDRSEFIGNGVWPDDLLFVAIHLEDVGTGYNPWYEAGVYCYATKAATVAAPSAPTGTVTTTQTPTLAATVSSIVESWQVPSGLASFMCGVTVEFSVYAGTLTSPSGTPIWKGTKAATISTYGDGTTPTTQAVSAVPSALADGAYTVFSRVSRDHPSAIPAWSNYSHAYWTQSTSPPTAPTFAATQDTAGQRATLATTASATTGYTSATAKIEVQRQVGSSWVDVRGLEAKPVTVAMLNTSYDYEAARGATNNYRARVLMVNTASGFVCYSGWTTASCTGPAVSGWNLKALDSPAANWVGARVTGMSSESSQRVVGVLNPVDGDYPVTVSGAMGGIGGSLTLLAAGATEIATIKALSGYVGSILLEDPYGEAKYISATKYAWDRHGAVGSERRLVTMDYAEVGS